MPRGCSGASGWPPKPSAFSCCRTPWRSRRDRPGARLSAISHGKRTRNPSADGKITQTAETYRNEMEARNWCDFDDLVIRAADALEADAGTRAQVREWYPWVCVDEYQDVDEQQVPPDPADRAARRQHLRHRRPRPGRLRLPGRGPAVLLGVHRTLPGVPDGAAQPQLPFRPQHRLAFVAGHGRGGLGRSVGPGARRRPQPRHPPRSP